MSVVALTVPLELSDAGAVIPIPAGGGAGNGVIFTVDTAGFNSISVQLNGVWKANVHFEISNDAVNWVSVQGFASNSNLVAIDTTTVSDVYLIPVIGRYFRLDVSGYKSGPIGVTAYLRFQSLAGIGEAALTQAMDSSIGTPIQTTFAGIQGPGQQPAKNSMPVTLSNENIQDLYITGRAFTQSGTYVGYNMLLSAEQSASAPGAPLDCLQYRSIYFQFNSAGPAGGTNTVNATFSPEQSNDLVNWISVAIFDLRAGNTVGVNEVTSFNPVNYGGSGSFGCNLMMRFFRLRCSGFGSTSFIQFTTTLRMTAFTYRNEVYANVNQQGASGMPNAATPTASGTISAAFPPFIIGGTDRSVIRSELIGAPYNNLASYTNGPYARNAYFDLAGNQGVSGPQPFLSEDKTYPVNVRLERTTKGQDSVQDLLQQILYELKAQTYYLREMPLSIAIQNQYGNPLSAGIRTPMADDPENFYDDVTLTLYRKGS